MNKDLKYFNENVKILNKNFAQYEDEKGFYLLIGTAQLICGVTYNEFTEPEFKGAIFNQVLSKTDKLEDFNKITILRPVQKNDKAGKDGKVELTEETVEAYQVWIVRNQLGLSKAYNNMEEAVKFAKSINEKIINVIGE